MIRKPIVKVSGEDQQIQEADNISDIHVRSLAPVGNITIPTNTSAIVVRKFAIASGKKLTIESGGIFKIT